MRSFLVYFRFHYLILVGLLGRSFLLPTASMAQCTPVWGQLLVQERLAYSTAMDTALPFVAILPDGYLARPEARFPVVYLLHGHSGNQRNWLERVPELIHWANLFELIIITPTGGFDSWYFDSPEQPRSRYATFIGRELVVVVDSLYRTLQQRESRGITGLSMGGHGALWLAAQYPEVFGAAASMSGGLDLQPFPNNWGIVKHLGDPGVHAERWRTHSMVSHPQALAGLALLIDCGVEDFFFATNQAMHEALLQAKVPHEYWVRPGGHSWAYWRNAVADHLLFFKKHLKTAP